MTKYRFSDGAAIVFGGSGGLGSGIVDLLSKCGTDVAFTYLNNCLLYTSPSPRD